MVEHILKVESVRFTDGFDTEREEEPKMPPRSWPKQLKDGVSIS